MESLKGKLTKEEFIEIMSCMTIDAIYVNQALSNAKQKGYIKQNPVEKAENEIIDIRLRTASIDDLSIKFVRSEIRFIMDTFENAINHLKKQLEEK